MPALTFDEFSDAPPKSGGVLTFDEFSDEPSNPKGGALTFDEFGSDDSSFSPVDAPAPKPTRFEDLSPEVQEQARQTVGLSQLEFAGSNVNPTNFEAAKEGLRSSMTPAERFAHLPLDAALSPEAQNGPGLLTSEEAPDLSFLNRSILPTGMTGGMIPTWDESVAPNPQTTAQAIGSGAYEGLRGVLTGGNAVLAAAIPELPSPARAAISAYFAGSLTHDAAAQLGEASVLPSGPLRTQAITKALVAGGMGALAAMHVGSELSSAITEKTAAPQVQIEPDLGIVKTPDAVLKIDQGVPRPLTAVEEQSAAALKGPEAVAALPEGTISQSVGEEIPHPIVGRTVDFKSQSRLADEAQDNSSKITKVTRREDTRGGSQMIEVHFDDGTSYGANAGLQSDGRIVPVDQAIETAIKRKGNLRPSEDQTTSVASSSDTPTFQNPTKLQALKEDLLASSPQGPNEQVKPLVAAIDERLGQLGSAPKEEPVAEAPKPSEAPAPSDIPPHIQKLARSPTISQGDLETELGYYDEGERSDLQKSLGSKDNDPGTLAADLKDKFGPRISSDKDAYVSKGPTTMQEEDFTGSPPPPETPNGTAPSLEPEPEPQQYGITKADTIARRSETGLPERVALQQSTWEEAQAHAAMIDAEDPRAAERLAQTAASGSNRAFTAEEKALLQNHYAKANDEYIAANDRFNLAKDSGDNAKAFSAAAVRQEARDRLHEAAKALENAGSISGAALNAQKMVANSRFELGHLLSEAEASKGEPLTESEKDSLQEKAQKVKESASEVTRQEQRVRKESADSAVQDQIKEHAKEVASESKPAKQKATKPVSGKILSTLHDARDAALARIKERRGKVMSNPLAPLAHVADEAIVGASHLADGIVNFADWSKRMIEDLGDKIRPSLTTLFRQSKDYLESQHSVEAIFEKMATRVKDGVPFEDLASYVKRMGKELIRSGITDRDELVKALHDRVRQILPDVSRTEVRDAYSGYGDFRPLSKDEVSVKDRDLKQQLQAQAKIEALQQGRPLEKSGPERPELSDEGRRMNRQVEELKKTAGVQVTDPETQLRTTLQAHERQLSNAIKDITTEIETGERKGKTPSPTNDRIEQLRDILNRLRETRDAIFGKKGLTDEQRLKAATDAANRMADEYDRQVRQEDFSRQKGKPKLTSPEYEAAKARRDAARAQRDEYRALDADYQKQSEAENQRRSLASAKTRTLNSIADLKDRLARRDFAKPPKRAPVIPDKALLEARAKNEALKRQIQEGFLKMEHENRSGFQKAIDFETRFVRNSFLSIPSIIGKLAIAVAYRPLVGSLGESVGAVWRKVLPELAKRAPYEGGPIRPIAESKAMARGAWDGIKDTWHILKTGKSTISDAFGDNRPEVPQNVVFRTVQATHDVMKNPLKRAVLERSFLRRSEADEAKGVDSRDPAITSRNWSLAYQDAQRSVLQQKGDTINFINGWLKKKESIDPKTGQPDIGKVLAAALVKNVAPIRGVPINFFKESAELSGGLPLGLAKALQAYHAGIEKLPGEQADQILRLLKKGWIGPAMMLFGYFNRNNIGGFYVRNQKNKDGSPEIGKLRVAGHDLPSEFTDSPMANVMNAGATFGHTLDASAKKTVPDALGASFLGLLDKLPGVPSMFGLEGTSQAGGAEKYIGNAVSTRLVPGVLRYAARLQDSKNFKAMDLLHPEPVERQPKTFSDYLKQSIPGLRKTVPQKSAPSPKDKTFDVKF